jgi:hypothetical protein
MSDEQPADKQPNETFARMERFSRVERANEVAQLARKILPGLMTGFDGFMHDDPASAAYRQKLTQVAIDTAWGAAERIYARGEEEIRRSRES